MCLILSELPAENDEVRVAPQRAPHFAFRHPDSGGRRQALLGANSATPRSGCGPAGRRCSSGHVRPHRVPPGVRLLCAESRISRSSAGLSDQLHHTALGDAVAPTKFGRGSPSCVLSHQEFDLLGVQPLANPPLVVTAAALSWPRWRLVREVSQHGRVQSESCHPDQWNAWSATCSVAGGQPLSCEYSSKVQQHPQCRASPSRRSASRVAAELAFA